jgi:hypothetical protein
MNAQNSNEMLLYSPGLSYNVTWEPMLENLIYFMILLKRIISLPRTGWIYGTKKIIPFLNLNPDKCATVGKISTKFQSGLKIHTKTDMIDLPN